MSGARGTRNLSACVSPLFWPWLDERSASERVDANLPPTEAKLAAGGMRFIDRRADRGKTYRRWDEVHRPTPPHPRILHYNTSLTALQYEPYWPVSTQPLCNLLENTALQYEPYYITIRAVLAGQHSATLWPQKLDRLTLGKLDPARAYHMHALRLQTVTNLVMKQAPHGAQNALPKTAVFQKRCEKISM